MKPAEQMVAQAARSGDITLLEETIRLYPNALREIDERTFIDTPLHVAASEGQAPFAEKMLRLMPSYARKPNSKGFTPLHCAARKGDVELLATFLQASPESMEDVTIRGETALMVALKDGKMEAFEFLLGWVLLGYDDDQRGRSWKKRKNMTVGLKDDHGSTLAQLYSTNRAASHKPEVLQVLDIASLEDWSRLLGFANPFLHYFRPDQKLMLAAYSGDINGLFSCLSEDPGLLERIDKAPFVDTPLHIAASAGNTLFALEIMRLKPSLARKLNIEGNSPLHLAIKKSQFDTMLRLVDVDNELVRVKGKDGKTPLHCTVEMGTSTADHIARLLLACPDSILDLTDRKETTLHLAIKIDRLDALEVLYGWLVRFSKKEIFTWADEEGQNLWRIAEDRNNDVVMKWLAEATNLRSLRGIPRVIARAVGFFYREKDLDNSEARATSFYGLISLGDYLRSKMSPVGEMAFRLEQLKKHAIPPEDRDAILVVLALIATATYQAILSPPGGLWQGDPTLPFSHNSTENSSSLTAKALSLVGQTVMRTAPRNAFFALNTAAFSMSVSLMMLMLPPGSQVLLFIMILLMLCYVIAAYAIGHVFFIVWVLTGSLMLYAMVPYVLQLCYGGPLTKADKRFSSQKPG